MNAPTDRSAAIFENAAAPEVFTILGRELRPFCIGHAIFLRRFNCEPVLSLQQLLTAVLVCSCRWEEILTNMRDPWLPLRMKIWRWNLGRFDLTEKINLFRSYQASHLRGPQIVEDDAGSGRIPGAPWLQHLRVTLMGKLGYTIREAMNTCYAQALWDYYTHFENMGRAEIVGDDHYAMHDLANQLHEKTVRSAGFSLSENRPVTPDLPTG